MTVTEAAKRRPSWSTCDELVRGVVTDVLYDDRAPHMVLGEVGDPHASSNTV